MSLDHVRNILLILSGKGGVGKSSITTQLALSLSLAGKSVGILDIDLTGPSIPRLLGIESSKIKQAQGGWLPVEVHSAQTLKNAPPITYPLPPTTTQNGTNGASNHAATEDINSQSAADNETTSTDPQTAGKRIGSVYAMSLAFLLASREAAIVWRGPKKTAMVRQFLTDVLWPELDYLLIDTPPGTSDEHISVVETLLKNVATTSLSTGSVTRGPNLAGAVVVTTPQAVAVSDVRKELNFCAKTGVKIVGVVENMSGYICPCCGVEAKLFSKGGGKVMADEFKVPFLGYVPVDQLWGQLVEEGKRPVYESIKGRGGGADALDEQIDQLNVDNRVEADDEAGERDEEAKEREPGLLVDKYRNCSLSPVFADICRSVIATVDDDTAVSLSKNAVRA